MIEYLHNAIMATAGEDIAIVARITDEEGAVVEDNCGFIFYGVDGAQTIIEGVYSIDGFWTFTIPAELTKGLKGRYGYCICNGSKTLCFEKPLYLK